MDGMGLRMKNSHKNLIGRGGHKKPIYRGDCLKRGLGKKEEGGVFEGQGGGGEVTSMHTMFMNSSVHLVKTS